MAEVLLSSDDLTVLGGPAEISVDVDFGPKGDRGSLIFYGLGKPDEISTLPEDLKAYDTYINALTSDDEYQFLYQYISADGGTPSWVKIFKLTTNTYSQNYSRNFVDGAASVNIPVSLIVPEGLVGDVPAENFNVQANIINQNPVSLSTTVSEVIIVDDQTVLPLTFSAIEYDSGTWQSLAGQKTIHLLITMV
jgi:hypothetical protein